MADTPVRVILVDDHSVVREGLRALLERDAAISVVGEAETGAAAITLAVRLAPEVVVMDFALPDITGVAACRAILEKHPEIRVIFLSMHEEEAYFIHALQAGAVGYLVKRSAAAEIRAAVLGAASGEIVLAPTLASVLVRHLQSPNAAPPDPLAPLTPREREVLHLVAAGHTSQAIANQLSISIKTVQAHREHIMEKLNLRDITHLVRFAVRAGVIPADA